MNRKKAELVLDWIIFFLGLMPFVGIFSNPYSGYLICCGFPFTLIAGYRIFMPR